ncbi:RGM domain family member B [Armadillidium nasatum]|uniref:RGM domain family member B n=1 Tax=Armadillidium nasatum TaxID=96803 RepID=A0A5N5TGR9_9CRUS|nr:RGM domain family member B [Armadillidium nasatum]
MGWSLFEWLLLWVLCRLLIAEEIGVCDTQSCIKDFSSRTRGLREGPNRPYCVHLKHYMKCVQEQSKACHGNILFHGIKISVETLMVNNRCEQILAQEGHDGVDGEEEDAYPVSPLPEDPCGYKGPGLNPAHCGLFGDPHLKIFNGTFMTCRVKGAWPMLSSSHLAIQVTNEAVAPDFKATATTKVTVLIKSNPTCGPAKTYEASSESLPKAFIDGTTFSGHDLSHPFANVTESESGRHVLIRIKSINTVVSIRKIGNYLSVAVTMPEEIIETMSDTMQLCINGCPISEQLSEAIH